jgi:hypothetical protein
MPFIVLFFKSLAGWLLSGIVAKLIISLIINGLILGSIFLFTKNFAATSLNYALSMFDFFGWTEIVHQIQGYYNQLPPTMLQTLAYFQLGPLMGLFVNSYIASIFLAWIMRRFG